MGNLPTVSERSSFLRRAEETNRPSSVDKITPAQLCRGGSGPPETRQCGPVKSYYVNGFARGPAVSGSSGSAVIVTGATNTAVSVAGRRHAANKRGPPGGATSEARRDGMITVTATGPTGHAAGSGA